MCFTFSNAALHLSARRWQLSYSVYSAGGELLTSTEEIIPPTRFGVPGWRVSNLWGSSPCGSYRGSYSSASPSLLYIIYYSTILYYKVVLLASSCTGPLLYLEWVTAESEVVGLRSSTSKSVTMVLSRKRSLRNLTVFVFRYW